MELLAVVIAALLGGLGFFAGTIINTVLFDRLRAIDDAKLDVMTVLLTYRRKMYPGGSISRQGDLDEELIGAIRAAAVQLTVTTHAVNRYIGDKKYFLLALLANCWPFSMKHAKDNETAVEKLHEIMGGLTDKERQYTNVSEFKESCKEIGKLLDIKVSFD